MGRLRNLLGTSYGLPGCCLVFTRGFWKNALLAPGDLSRWKRSRPGAASWEPSYASLLLPMQDRVHKYVIAGEGTAKEALDALVDDWTEVFEDEGKL